MNVHEVTDVAVAAVFAATYLELAMGRLPVFRVDRTGVAIIGAAAMVVIGAIPWDAAVAAVDFHTLALLFGMMVVAAYLRLSGFFGLVTTRAVRLARTPVGLLALLIAASGVLSALFVNDVVCLVLAPLVIDLTRRLELPPLPYLIALATASNVGSVATLTGNPQNMLVASFSSIGYRAFLLREGPVALAGLLATFGIIWLVHRRDLPSTLAALPVDDRLRVHYPLLIKTSIVVAIMLAAFLAGAPVALVAIAGAAYTLFTRRVNPEKIYREINWELLVLFTGLFVVIGAVEASGLGRLLVRAAHAANLGRPLIFTLVTAAVSNLVSNVPAVLILKSLVVGSADPGRGWLLLAMASTLAGNLTIVGSVANLIVVEAAREARVPIGFIEYSWVGVPLTVLTLLLGGLILVLLPV